MKKILIILIILAANVHGQKIVTPLLWKLDNNGNLSPTNPAWSVSAGGTKGAYVTTTFSTTSTSYVDVTGMSIPIDANKSYQIIVQGYADTQAAASLQAALSLPAGYIRLTGKQITSSPSYVSANDVTSEPALFMNTISPIYFYFYSYLKNGTNAGNVKLQLKSGDGSAVRFYLGKTITVGEVKE